METVNALKEEFKMVAKNVDALIDSTNLNTDSIAYIKLLKESTSFEYFYEEAAKLCRGTFSANWMNNMSSDMQRELEIIDREARDVYVSLVRAEIVMPEMDEDDYI